MLSSKQENYWYHFFYIIFGIMLSDRGLNLELPAFKASTLTIVTERAIYTQSSENIALLKLIKIKALHLLKKLT